MQSVTPRVILRSPRRGRYGEDEVLVLEMGISGAKLEHSNRLHVNGVATFTCGPLTTEGTVRHSVLLPGIEGVIYQSAIEFTQAGGREHELLFELIAHEAETQVVEWEANLRGELPERSSKNVRRSATAPRYIRLRLTPHGWQRASTADPKQPADGVAIVDGTPEEEIAVLRQTYETSDESMRDLLRRVATVAIVSQMRERASPGSVS
jgi:hypothetical protein